MGSPESCRTPEHFVASSFEKSLKNVSVANVSVNAMPVLVSSGENGTKGIRICFSPEFEGV